VAGASPIGRLAPRTRGQMLLPASCPAQCGSRTGARGRADHSRPSRSRTQRAEPGGRPRAALAPQTARRCTRRCSQLVPEAVRLGSGTERAQCGSLPRKPRLPPSGGPQRVSVRPRLAPSVSRRQSGSAGREPSGAYRRPGRPSPAPPNCLPAPRSFATLWTTAGTAGPQNPWRGEVSERSERTPPGPGPDAAADSATLSGPSDDRPEGRAPSPFSSYPYRTPSNT